MDNFYYKDIYWSKNLELKNKNGDEKNLIKKYNYIYFLKFKNFYK